MNRACQFVGVFLAVSMTTFGQDHIIGTWRVRLKHIDRYGLSSTTLLAPSSH